MLRLGIFKILTTNVFRGLLMQEVCLPSKEVVFTEGFDFLQQGFPIRVHSPIYLKEYIEG